MLGNLLGDPVLFLVRIVFLIPALLIGLVLHEAAHAYVAVARGDDTPRRQGRTTLDPRRHLDPLGVVLVFLAGFGYARPVQINPAALRGRLAALSVALAGPLANLAIAIAVSIPIKLLGGGDQQQTLGLLTGTPLVRCSLTAPPGTLLLTELQYVFTLNLFLMVFNLFPVPPLDGFELVRSFLRTRNPRLLFQIGMNQQSIILVLVLVFIFLPGFFVGIIVFFARPIAALLGVPLYTPC